MIFVALGTHERPFYRLVKEIDSLSENLKEKAVVQLGFTDYVFVSKNIKCYKYLTPQQFEKNLKKCSIFITHAGAGSIMSGIRLKKPVIVVPRLKEFNEHVDNHQLQITKKMQEHGTILPVYDINDLWKMIKKSRKIKPKELKTRSPIFDIIERILEKWSKI